jgi:hypothetical protein
MIHTRKITLLILLALATGSSCTAGLKNSMEIKTNGFITDNCYQALLELEPDDSARGLVARRESSYLKAKKTELSELALQNLANYCIDSQSKAGLIDKSKKEFDQNGHRTVLINRLKGLAGGGQIAFVFYNEKNNMIIGYRIFKIGFKKKLDALINAQTAEKRENTSPPARS